jgi:hypothetical protein
MDTRIWKYPLAITDIQAIDIPVGSRLLSVGNQNGTLCLWAIVPTQNAKEDRCIEIIGTGNPVPEAIGLTRRFIGTVIMNPFVWHVFERVNE